MAEPRTRLRWSRALANGTAIAPAMGMGYPLRWFVPDLVYELTTRTIQERFLLRPSQQARDLVLGVLGRGLALYPQVSLHSFAYLSNHSHLLASSRDGDAFVHFFGYINSNVARELGRLHGWRGPFWGQRGRPIPVLDHEAAVGRLRYIMAQGVKEGLVASPRDWPGATATPALIGDERLVGTWIHRDFEARDRRRAVPLGPESYTEQHEVVLTPIPGWQHLPHEEIEARHRSMLEAIEREHAAAPCAGVAAVLAVDPHARPAEPARRTAPLCHSSRAEMRAAFRAAYRAFVDAFRRGMTRAQEALSSTWVELMPPGSFPRPPVHVPYTPGAVLLDLEVSGIPPPGG